MSREGGSELTPVEAGFPCLWGHLIFSAPSGYYCAALARGHRTNALVGVLDCLDCHHGVCRIWDVLQGHSRGRTPTSHCSRLPPSVWSACSGFWLSGAGQFQSRPALPSRSASSRLLPGRDVSLAETYLEPTEGDQLHPGFVKRSHWGPRPPSVSPSPCQRGRGSPTAQVVLKASVPGTAGITWFKPYSFGRALKASDCCDSAGRPEPIS